MPSILQRIRWAERILQAEDAAAYRRPLSVSVIVVTQNQDSYPLCPRCGHWLEREYVGFCDTCGQRLRWDRIERAELKHLGTG